MLLSSTANVAVAKRRTDTTTVCITERRIREEGFEVRWRFCRRLTSVYLPLKSNGVRP